MAKSIRIKKQPKLILVSIHGGKYFNYWVDDFIRNKYTDVGVWKIKYKNDD
jgi:hypothetical protein